MQLFVRYAVPPSEQLWVFDGRTLMDAQKLNEVGMDKVALFCPVHVRVFQKFKWPTIQVRFRVTASACGVVLFHFSGTAKTSV